MSAPRRRLQRVVDVEEPPRVLGLPRAAVIGGTALLAVLATALAYAATRPSRDAQVVARAVPVSASAPGEAEEKDAAQGEEKGRDGAARGAAPAGWGRARLQDPDQFEANVALVVGRLDTADERAIYRTIERYDAGAGAPRANLEHLVAVLVKLTADEDARVRRGALAVLGRVPPDALVTDPFGGAMCDRDPGVRREAATACARHGIGRHWPYVLPLTRDEDAGVRVAAAQALAGVNRDEVRDALLGLLADRADDVVEAAAEAVARTVRDVPPPAALAALRSDRPRVRVAAAHVLAASHGPQCLDPLVSLLDDPVDEVRCTAIGSLPRFTGAQAGAACAHLVEVASSARRSEGDRFEALQALSRTAAPPSKEAVWRVASSAAEPLVRLAAARTLLGLGDSRACATLAALAETQPGPSCHRQVAQFVRDHAVAALRAIDAAAPAADGPDAWRALVPTLEVAVRRDGFGYRPEYLTQRW